MGLIDDKKDIFATIGAYVSLAEELKEKVGQFAGVASEYADIGQYTTTTNLYPSINNRDDIGAFLLDVLGVVVGTSALQDLTGQLFANFIPDVEDTLKSSTLQQLTNFNSGLELPQSFRDGITVPISNLDVYGKFLNSPTSDAGTLLYDFVDDNFDKSIYQAITNGNSTYLNLNIEYDSNIDAVTFTPTTATENNTIGEWMSEYVENAKFLDPKEFVTRIIDRMYGSVSSNEEKTVERLTTELSVDKILQDVINGDDNFVIPDSELNEITNLAEQYSLGIITYDMGCGIIQSELPLSGLSQLVGSISGLTNPDQIGRDINTTIGNSFEDTGDEETSDENEETIRNGFFARLIEFLKLELAKILTTSPQARMLLALKSSFENEGVPQIENAIDDLQNFKVYINCVIKDILAALYEFIFNLIVGILVALIAPIIIRIIKEKINQYISIIRSLISSRL